MRRFSHILKRKNIILFVSFAEKMCFTLVMLAFAPYHFIYIYFFLKSCINKWLSLAFGHFATVVASDGVHQF